MSNRYRMYPSRWLATCAAVSLLTFAACSDDNGTEPPTTGSIEVTVATTGSDVDADGYTVQLDGADAQPIGVNGSLSYSDLEPGSHQVSLTGLEANCSVSGSNPVTVTVTAGESVTAAFAVVCEELTGSIEVTTATSGDNIDPDGYTVLVDGANGQSIAVDGSVTFPDIVPGTREVTLDGVADNCSVGGDNPRSLDVQANQTASTTFTVTCDPVTGTVEVTTSTTGADLDSNGYTLSIDGVPNEAIGVNETLAVSGVIEGERSVELLDVAANCSVSGDNPRTVAVPQEATVTTTFEVACTALTGDLEVTANTTGDDLDADGYMVSVDGGPAEALPTNGSFAFTGVAIGDRSVEVTGVASNCTVQGDNPATVTVPSGGTAMHTFDISCVQIVGSIEVTTSTTGAQPDPDGYELTVGAGTPVAIGVNQTVTVNDVAVGDRDVELIGLASNCSVIGENPRTLTVTDGGTATTTFDVECPAALSNQIVFDTDRDGNTNIYVMDANGANQTQLTSHAARDAEPYVSPNGAKIAFASERDGNREIYVMNSDGTGQTPLTSDPAKDAQPAWSPDGTKIAFQSDRDGNPEIYVMDADGSNVVRLTNDAGEDGLPSWSPDGTRIVFYSNRDGDEEIYTMDSADGLNLEQLTFNTFDDFAPAWSPDGSQIAFTSERDGNREIYRMNTNGSSQERLTTDGAADIAPAWSPDGSQIAFSSLRDGDYEVFVMNADGSGQTPLTNNTDNDFEVSWSP